MKKILSLIASLAITLGISATATELVSTDPAAIDRTPSLMYNAELQTIENIKNVNGRVMLPFRAVFEMMGATVDYEDGTRKVTAVRGTKTVEFIAEGTEITVTENGNKTVIPAEIGFDYERNRVMVPVRFVSNALGARVGWNDFDKCVYVLDTYPMIEALKINAPAFLEYAEMSSVLEKNIKTDTAMDLGISGTFDGVSAKADASLTGSSEIFNNTAKASAVLSFKHEGLDVLTGSNIGNLEGATFDALKTEDAFYFKTNLFSKLSTLVPDLAADLAPIQSIIKDDTWFRLDYSYIEKEMGKVFSDAMFKGTEASADEIFKLLETSYTLVDADVTYEEMFMVKTQFDAFTNLFSKATFEKINENSFNFKMNITTDDIAKSIIPRYTMEDTEYALVLATLKTILSLDITADVAVKDGILEKEDCTLKMMINFEPVIENFNVTMNITGKSAKQTAAPVFTIPEKSLSIESIMTLLG